MSVWRKEGEENEEENENDEEEEFQNSHDRILFLIDAREAMCSLNSKGESHLRNCLTVALEVMKTKVIAQDMSSIGVTFFGTREKDAHEGTDGIFTLFPLGPPSAQNIRQLSTLVDDLEVFHSTIGCQRNTTNYCPLKQALWSCSQSFASKDLKKTDFKRIWLFTNDDNPNANFPAEQRAIVIVARDCAQANIEISLWHLNPSSYSIFNPKLFYCHLLTMATPNVSDVDQGESGIDERMLGAGFDSFAPLLVSIRRKTFRKRRMGQLLFAFSDIPHGPLICVQLYKTLQIVKRPLHTWLHGKTNEPVKSVSHFIDSTTGEHIEVDQIETFVDVQGYRVPFTSQEMAAFKQYESTHWPTATAAATMTSTTATATVATTTSGNGDPTAALPTVVTLNDGTKVTVGTRENGLRDAITSNIPGIRLLYCLPRTAIPLTLNLTTPYFLYPGERVIKGSAILFEALLRSLLAKNLVGIVRFTRNLLSSKPCLALLLPQQEVIEEETGCQSIAPGFHVIALPCIEDIRFNPQPQNLLYNDDSVETLAEPLGQTLQQYVQAMTLPQTTADSGGWEYSKDVDNPALQAFYATLQAIALGESETSWNRETHDNMLPPKEKLQEGKPIIQQLQEILGIDGEGDGEEEEKGKKTAAKGRKPAATTKAKATATAGTGRGRKTTKAKEDVEEEEDEEESVTGKRKRAATTTKKAAAGKSRGGRSKKADDDDEDEEVEEKPKKRAATTRGKATSATTTSSTRVKRVAATSRGRVAMDEDEEY
jgi:ATP-dependent DNA helicase 2 subunit 1